MSRWLTAVLALSLLACVTPPAVDLESADMRGSITRITEDGRYLVESPAGSAGVGKCVVRLIPETELSSTDGTPVGSLVPGTEVSVWFTGPVMKSYPAQASAARLVVHRGAQTGRTAS
jgi:hypothetical protein